MTKEDKTIRRQSRDAAPHTAVRDRLSAAFESAQTARDVIVDALDEYEDEELEYNDCIEMPFLRRALEAVNATQHSLIEIADVLGTRGGVLRGLRVKLTISQLNSGRRE